MNSPKSIYLFTSFLCFVFFTASSLSQEPPDIYDRIASLSESLRVWSEHPPSPWEADTISLDELFPGADISSLDSSGFIYIALPVYMNLLTTELTLLSVLDDSLNEGAVQWEIHMKAEADHLVIDSVSFPYPQNVLEDMKAIELIKNRLIELRTIGLPDGLQAEPVLSSATVSVKLRAKESVQFSFTSAGWHGTLSHLAAGMQVYAGLIDIENNDSAQSIRYYLLLTMPDADGHHFMTLTDMADNIDNTWTVSHTSVKILPYIRTDNLKDLFDSSRDHPGGPKLRIKLK